jgi:hypothetical protein
MLRLENAMLRFERRLQVIGPGHLRSMNERNLYQP